MRVLEVIFFIQSGRDVLLLLFALLKLTRGYHEHAVQESKALQASR